MKDYKTLALTIAVALAVTGCATTYQSQGFSGGFTEMPMSADTYRIQFRGNAFTSSQQTQEMAMLRAAELAIDHGYAHFVILGAGDSAETSYYNQPGTTHTQINPNGMGGYNATSSNYGGFSAPISKPRSEIVVKFVGPDQGGLDAAQILQDLGAQYGAQ